MFGRWVVTLEFASTGMLVDGAPRHRFMLRGWAKSHCNWRNARWRIKGCRWVVVDRRTL